MPRRTRPRRRGQHRGRVAALEPAVSTASTDAMALELVRRGKASPAILGSHRPPTETEQRERNDQ